MNSAELGLVSSGGLTNKTKIGFNVMVVNGKKTTFALSTLKNQTNNNLIHVLNYNHISTVHKHHRCTISNSYCHYVSIVKIVSSLSSNIYYICVYFFFEKMLTMLLYCKTLSLCLI